MPFVTISTAAGKPPQTLQAVANAVFAAQETVLGVTPGMRFAQVHELQPHQMAFNAPYIGAADASAVFVVQVLLFAGRTPELKKQFADAAIQNIANAAGTEARNVLLLLIENQRSDWYYANQKPSA
jgi:phenylpyruvate tautomerase PptA (4-oxalocrotonate tautomerase family)